MFYFASHRSKGALPNSKAELGAPHPPPSSCTWALQGRSPELSSPGTTRSAVGQEGHSSSTAPGDSSVPGHGGSAAGSAGQSPAGGEGAPPEAGSSAAQGLARQREGKAFSAKQGPRKPDSALLEPWGRPQLKWKFEHFYLRS